MATDEKLLDEIAGAGGAYLRFYRWDPPTLSVGRNQPVTVSGVPIVRRPTGGQAVWHDDEVTYAVVAPIHFFGSLRKAYCEIHNKLATAIRSLGTDPVLAPTAHRPIRPSATPATPATPSCFAVPAGGEILVAGRKLVGSAQLRRGDAFLQHGSILLDGAQPFSQGGEITLAAVLGRHVTFAEVVTAVIAAWGEPLDHPTRPPSGPSARPEIASAAAG